MSFKELTIKSSYISKGPESFVQVMLLPALKHARSYKRSVGYFSGSEFESIAEGLIQLAGNHGTIQLIATPNLSEEDSYAIQLGTEERDVVINSLFTRDFEHALNELSDECLELLEQLIALQILDIKIAITKDNEMYQDKLGILTDESGNTIVFYGNSNATQYGNSNHYEKVRTLTSWNSDQSLIDDEINEFNLLWEGHNPYVDVFDFADSAAYSIAKINDERNLLLNDAPVVLRDYQQEAVNAWINNGYNGFLVMATGTGKTWTALFAAKELTEKEDITIVITAPYKHLIKQWAEDIEKLFQDSTIILVSSENPNWEKELTNEILYRKFSDCGQLIVVSTIASFNKDKFKTTISKDKHRKLLIVDEAHRFTDRTPEVQKQYKYMLGLSATPYRGTSAESGNELMEYFGGRVYNLPIEEALKKKCLVGYYYKPIYVYATAEEEEQFNEYTTVMASCFVDNICIDLEKLVRARSNRLRVISMSEQKQKALESIIRNINEEDHLKDHLIVYCGDGKLYDENTKEIKRHIDSVKAELNRQNYKPNQFTARENIKERMRLIDSFNKGTITALAAIRCLDEGINIPSIKGALILSSNDDYREFVQRRGRILRTYPGKEYATIYDVIVLPGSYMKPWAKIEFRRFYEYAKLAINAEELELELTDYLKDYWLTKDDIDVFEFDVEDALDE